jgi:hypothetical protein
MIDRTPRGAKIVNSHPKRNKGGDMSELKGAKASVPTFNKVLPIHVVQDLEGLRFPSKARPFNGRTEMLKHLL